MIENITDMRIGWGDLDPLGIVFYPRYYAWMDECGHLFFKTAGIPCEVMWQERGIVFGLVETGSRYFKAGRYHQNIRIITRITSLDSKTLTFSHVVQDAEDGSRMVEGTEKRICMDASDPENLKAIDIPKDVFSILKRAMI
jgi:YbgC/YbaW family acyl-CoA thioester hydrolase